MSSPITHTVNHLAFGFMLGAEYFYHQAEAGYCWLSTSTKTSNTIRGQDLTFM